MSLDSVKAGVQWAPTMSEIQVHNGSGSASSHKPAVAVVNSNFNKQAPETLPEYTVTLDGDKLQSIRWIGSEGNVLSSLDEGDYTVSGEGDKVTVKIAADFLKGKDAGNYGLQFEFASVAPRKVSLNVTDEAVEPSKPTTPAKPGANEQPKTEGVAKAGSSVPAVATGTTMIVRKRATR